MAFKLPILGLRTLRVCLKPIGLSDLITLLPLIQPTFCTAHLPADHLNGVTGQVTLKRLLPAPLKG